MLKTVLATAGIFLGLASAAMAQSVPSIGVSTGSQVIDIRGVTVSNMEVWGSYESLDLSVGAGGSGSVSLIPGSIFGGSVGAVGSFQAIFQEGGYYGESKTRQTFTGQAQTSFVEF